MSEAPWKLPPPEPLTDEERDRRVALAHQLHSGADCEGLQELIELDAKRLAYDRWPSLSPEAIERCEQAAERLIDAARTRGLVGPTSPEWKSFEAALDEIYNQAE